MPALNVYLDVVFGAIFSGLGTVGYELFDGDKVSLGARTQTGVGEVRTPSGVYGVKIVSLPDNAASVLWDTGGANPITTSQDLELYHLRTAIGLNETEAAAAIRQTLNTGEHAATLAAIGAGGGGRTGAPAVGIDVTQEVLGVDTIEDELLAVDAVEDELLGVDAVEDELPGVDATEDTPLGIGAIEE